MNDECNMATFKFLNYKCGYWEIPRKSTDEEIEIRYVFHGPCQPIDVSKTGYKFDEEQVITTYNRLKRQNSAK